MAIVGRALMLELSFGLLAGAALIGAGLAIRYFRGPGAKSPPFAVSLLHAGLGTAGLAVLILALRRGLPSTGMGTAGFGPTAGALLAAALAVGLRLGWLAWRRHRASEMVVGTHAGLAIAGFVLVLALVALR